MMNTEIYETELLRNIRNTLSKFRDINEYRADTIYHYTSPSGLLGILKEGKVNLWFTQYDSLNDRNERLDITRSLADYCQEKANQKIISDNVLSTITQIKPTSSIVISREPIVPVLPQSDPNLTTYNELIDADCYAYLCCFSKNSDSLAMWNYYTKSRHYEGYSIGVSPWHLSHSQYKNSDYKLSVHDVIYTRDDKYRLFEEYFLPLLIAYDSASDEQKVSILFAVQKAVNNLQFIFKDEHFQHENEVRAILLVPKTFTQNNVLSERKYRESNGYIIPYVEYTLAGYDLREIITAPLFEQELAQNNLQSMLTQRGYTNVNIKPSMIPIRF